MKSNMLNNLSTTMMKKAGKAELLIKKNSPEILLGLGLIGFVGTVVSACKATTRADEVLEFHKQKIKDIHDAKEIADQNPESELEYDEVMYRQDLAVRYLKTTGNMVKLYAPAIGLGVSSIVCILMSRNIMEKRYLGVVAAYNGLSATFEQYRKRVRDEYGEQLDKHFRYGTTYDTMTEIEMDENGKNKKTKVDISNTDSNLVHPKDNACRFFDRTNPNWDPNPSMTMMWLRARQDYWNDLLHVRGHVFLNEVLDDLGFDHTPEGAVLGWIDHGDDGYIDFGLYDPKKESVRKFVNGTENSIMLEFNHDGVIYEYI